MNIAITQHATSQANSTDDNTPKGVYTQAQSHAFCVWLAAQALKCGSTAKQGTPDRYVPLQFGRYACMKIRSNQ